MTDIDLDPRFCSKTSKLQLKYGIWVNMTTMAIGLTYAFPAIQLPQLLSPASDILLSIQEVSWIASASILFSPIGCIINGFLLDTLGRRRPLLFSQLLMCLGWMYTSTAMNGRNIIIGRAITGVGCGMAMELPRLYISEISLVNMRGFLGAFPNIFLYLGITLQVAIGSFLTWQLVCVICFIVNLLISLSYLKLKESPQYFMVEDMQKALDVLTCFRSNDYNTTKEKNQMIKFKQENNIRRLTIFEKLYVMSCSFVHKPFRIATTYIAFASLSGVPVVAFWTISPMLFFNSSNVQAANILIAVTGLATNTLASALLYHIGRRPIAIISASGLGCSSLTLGLFLLFYTDDLSIAPEICFMIYTAIANLGFQCLPFLIMTEIYPVQIRGMLIGISLTFYNAMAFTFVKFFPYLHEELGISNILFIFGIATILAVIFLYFLLPETKGSTLQEIEEYFRGSRPALISDRAAMAAQIKDTKSLVPSGVAVTIAKTETSHRYETDNKNVEYSASLTSIVSRKSALLRGDKVYMNEETRHLIQGSDQGLMDIHEEGTSTQSKDDKKRTLTHSKTDNEGTSTHIKGDKDGTSTLNKSSKEGSSMHSKTDNEGTSSHIKGDKEGTSTQSKGDKDGTSVHSKSDNEDTSTHSKSDNEGTSTHSKSDNEGTSTHSKSDNEGTSTHSKSDKEGTSTHSKSEKPVT